MEFLSLSINFFLFSTVLCFYLLFNSQSNEDIKLHALPTAPKHPDAHFRKVPIAETTKKMSAKQPPLIPKVAESHSDNIPTKILSSTSSNPVQTCSKSSAETQNLEEEFPFMKIEPVGDDVEKVGNLAEMRKALSEIKEENSESLAELDVEDADKEVVARSQEQDTTESTTSETDSDLVGFSSVFFVHGCGMIENRKSVGGLILKSLVHFPWGGRGFSHTQMGLKK